MNSYATIHSKELVKLWFCLENNDILEITLTLQLLGKHRTCQCFYNKMRWNTYRLWLNYFLFPSLAQNLVSKFSQTICILFYSHCFDSNIVMAASFTIITCNVVGRVIVNSSNMEESFSYSQTVFHSQTDFFNINF